MATVIYCTKKPDNVTWDAWADILVTGGVVAGYLERDLIIDIPEGAEGQYELALTISTLAERWLSDRYTFSGGYDEYLTKELAKAFPHNED